MSVYCSLTMFSALAAVCTVDCAIEIVLITLHYIDRVTVSEVQVLASTVRVVSSARNLGVVIDRRLIIDNG